LQGDEFPHVSEVQWEMSRLRAHLKHGSSSPTAILDLNFQQTACASHVLTADLERNE
jgi:hypothetical protein